MNSLQIQALLPEKNQKDVCDWLLKNHYPCTLREQRLIYLAYLIARGQFEDTSHFLNDVYHNNRDEVILLLNTPHELFWDGTVLNFALYYNSGQRGMDFFELLYSRGALPLRDGYHLFPWQQLGKMIWMLPLQNNRELIDLGERDDQEFQELYNDIIKKYKF